MSTVQVESAISADVDERGPRLAGLTEDQWFDRMSSRSKATSLADKMIGFANAEGGVIVLGIHDGVVEGVDPDVDRLNEWRQAAFDFTVPPVRAGFREVSVKDADEALKSVVVVDVEPSEQVHANQKDEVYLRVGDENRKLRYREREELMFDKGQATFETRPLDDFDPEDLDDEVLASYADAVGHPDALRLLAARGLIRGETYTAAAVLLFASDPQIHFPEARIRILSYGASERGTGKRQQLREEVTLDGPIPRVLLAAQAEMRRLVPTRRALGQNGRFEEVPIIPEDAWLEGIVNAAVHRSYSLAGDHIRVEVFPDRIEIESPGRAPGLVRLSDPLNSNRFARNPRIARVCADLNFGQELGEGIRRMFDEMRLAGLTPPHYQETAGSVKLVLAALPAEPVLEDLRSEYAEIVRLLRMEGPKSSGEIASHMDISRPTLIRWMKELESLSLVRWKGTSSRDPTAVWVARKSS